MKSMHLSLISAFAVLCASMLVPGGAAAANTTDLQPQTANGATWLCGGVGLDESSAMQKLSRDYPLTLTFTAGNGAYLSDVQVTVSQKGREPIVDVNCGGPMMLLKLPAAGNYRLKASVNGQVQERKLSLKSGSHQRLMLRWQAAQAGLEAGAPQ